MFAALASILGTNQTLDISITAPGADGIMKVIVKPQLVKGSNAALAQPLALAASPQELDADFVGTLMQYAAERTSLQQQVNVTATIIADAKASEVGKASKAIKSSTKSSTKPETGEDGNDEGASELEGDDILGDAPAGPTSSPTAPAPAVKQTPAPAAASNDDLLSLM
jgi:PRTRC genetic system protein E